MTLPLFFFLLGIGAITYGCFLFSHALGWIASGFWLFVLCMRASFKQYVENEKKKKFEESNR